MAGPAAIPKALAVTKAADAAVRSDRGNVSQIYLRLIDLALPNPVNNRPIITNAIESNGKPREYNKFPNTLHALAKINACL